MADAHPKLPIVPPASGLAGPTAPLRDSLVAEAVRRTEETRALLLVLDGPKAGERIPLPDVPLVLGRSVQSHVHFPDEGMSARHAEIVPDGAGRFRLRDLGSLNGTLVNGRRTAEHRLEPGDRLMLGQTPLRYLEQTTAEEDLLRHLEQAAIQDPLTLLHNRRYFDLRLQQELAWSRRHGRCLGLLMIDLDRFKAVNDGWGHPVGDRLLVELAAFLRGCVCGGDVVARVGGEEFAALLRSDDGESVRRTAERLRAGVEALSFEADGRRIPITISVGALAFHPDGDRPPAHWVELADRELYRAKQSGRNRVCFASPAASPPPR